MDFSQIRSCRRCAKQLVACREINVRTCSRCRADNVNCSLKCTACIIGHRVCIVEGDSKGCTLCKRSGKVCVSGPTDPETIRSLKGPQRGHSRSLEAANSRSDSDEEESELDNLQTSTMAPATPAPQSTEMAKQNKGKKPVDDDIMGGSDRILSPQLHGQTPVNRDATSSGSGPYDKKFSQGPYAPYLNAVFAAARSGNLNRETVEAAAAIVKGPGPVVFGPPPPPSAVAIVKGTAPVVFGPPPPPSPRNMNYPARVPENIRRLYPLPDDYVPPSLPMLNPFRPVAVDPMISGGDLPGAILEKEVLIPWRPTLSADTSPLEPPSKVMAREYELGSDFDPFYEVTEATMDPTRPPLDKPDMPTFMCCNQVKPKKPEHTSDGGDQLKEVFTKFGHYYPADWSWINPDDADFAAAWNHNSAYIGIVDLDNVAVDDNMHEQADLYGCQDLNRGILGRMLCPIGRPKICTNEEARETSRHRFNLVVGADADFFCIVHSKSYYTFWCRFHEQGKEFIDIDA